MIFKAVWPRRISEIMVVAEGLLRDEFLYLSLTAGDQSPVSRRNLLERNRLFAEDSEGAWTWTTI
ncbi:hypothetical protein [Jiella avicenniae]|uniref:Uncharacterized protein n=1 Tax=Jiella avicenniae TaxID=2907202 RepID=A0A9X1P392_9HYPH|nr:hypothetical protein [Jiella avicenniae]MCE7029054.1 hypothetical protein [Jiella avicenniae]